MAATIFGLGLSQQFDVNGDPMSGAKLYLYQASTSTPVTSYSDFGLTSAQPWPLVADSTGRIPAFWLDDGDYRVRLTDADDILVFDELDVTAIGPPLAAEAPEIPDVPTTVEELTDYEEGSWTPTLTFFFNTGDLIVPYSTRTGSYVKVGNLVLFSFNVVASPVTHLTATGPLVVTGLPYAAHSSFDYQYMGAFTGEGITLPAGYTQLQGMIRANQTVVRFSMRGSALGLNEVDTTHVPSGGFVWLSCSGVYRTT